MWKIVNWVIALFIAWCVLSLFINISNNGLEDGGNWVAIIFIILSGGWLFYRNLAGGSQSIEDAFLPDKKKAKTNDEEKPTMPYPMESGARNHAVGAIDKCCEFAAFCEKYVIPTDRTRFKPERVWCYIQLNGTNRISYGFTWKTDDTALKIGLKQKGYSLGEGFEFNDDSGFISYSGEITNDPDACTYLANTPESEVISEFERIARNNFEGLGLTNHRYSCSMHENVGWKAYQVFID